MTAVDVVLHYCPTCDVEGTDPLCWLCHRPAEPLDRPAVHWLISAARYVDGKAVNTDLTL